MGKLFPLTLLLLIKADWVFKTLNRANGLVQHLNSQRTIEEEEKEGWNPETLLRR
jgi:hypothetical protein